MRDFNFFSSYLGEKKAYRKKYAIGAVFVAILLLLSGVYWSMEMKKQKLQSEIQAMQAFINSPELIEAKEEIHITQKQLGILREYYQAVESVETAVNGMERIGSSLIEELNSKIPPDIFFTNLALSRDRMNIQGVAVSRIAIAELVYNLKNLDRFSNVHVSTIQSQTEPLEDGSSDERFSFSLSCTLKDVMTQ